MVDDIQVVSNIETFVKIHCELIDAEIEEEKNALNYDIESPEIGLLEKKGVLINDLAVSNIRIEFGTCVVEFDRSTSKRENGPKGISSGDIASIWFHDEEARNKKTFLANGIIMRVGDIIEISFDNSNAFKWDLERKYFILKTISEVTFRRMKNGLKNILNYRYGRCSMIINHLFGDAKLEKHALHPSSLDEKGELKLYNGCFHPIQKETVKFCLEQKHFAIVHGPPGTGKTTVLVEIILQLVNSGQKILVCAPSNIAVDTIVEKLAPIKSKIIRIGKTARMLEASKFSSLGAAMNECDEASILKTVKEELEQQKCKLKTASRNAKKYVLQDIKDLKKEYFSRQYKILEELLKNANVVLTTLTSASEDGDLKNVPIDHFDVVIIDECSQAIEAACWIAIPRAPKVIIAGDHLQLPPTIKSKIANEKGLGVSLMERAIEKIGKDCYKLLVHQFRMNSLIMQWVNSFYDDKLVADASVAKHLLKDLPGVKKVEETETPLFLVDTAGFGKPEKEYRGSKFNESEADIIAVLVKRLVDAGVNENDISVITPYSLQVSCIKMKICNYSHVEVKTVDGFQGREKEAVIISLVRSNKNNELGFVSDKRRLNVAISRAQSFLAVIGDSATVRNDETIKSLFKHIEDNGVSYSPHEFDKEIYELSLPTFSAEDIRPKQASKPNEQKEKKGKSKNKKKEAMHNAKKVYTVESDKKTNKEEAAVEDLQNTFKGLLNSSPKKAPKGKKKNVPKPAVSPALLSLESSCSEGNRNTSTDSEVEITEVEEDKNKQKAKQTKILRKKKVVNNIKKSNDSDDSDEDLKAIEESKLRNTVCFMKGCKVWVKLYPYVCQHCKESFCIIHMLPEVHGCGEAAKRAARHNFRHNQPSKPADKDKKAASMKLKKKVALLASERKRHSKK